LDGGEEDIVVLGDAGDVDDQVDVFVFGEGGGEVVGFDAGGKLVVGEGGFAFFDAGVADGGDFVVVLALGGEEVGEVGYAALVEEGKC